MEQSKTESRSSSASRASQAATMSAASSSSSKQGKSGGQQAQSAFLTVTTRRRLLRKPLPKVPLATAKPKEWSEENQAGTIKADRTSAAPSTAEKLDHKRTESGASQSTSAGEAPTSIETEETTTDENKSPLPHTTIFAREAMSQKYILTLEEAKHKTAKFQEQERDILQWWPEPEEGRLVKTEAEVSPLQLDEPSSALLLQIIDYSLHTALALGDAQRTQVADSILAALHSCLLDITEPEILRALQKTASLLWRVDAIARTNEQAQGKAAAATMLGAFGARFPRLAPWRSLGVRDSASATTTPMWSPAATFDNAGEFPFQEKALNSGPATPNFNTEARRRKRDVFAQVLSNPLWIGGVREAETSDETATNKAKDGAKGSKPPNGTPLPKLLARQATPTVAVTATSQADDAATPADSEASLDGTSSVSSVVGDGKSIEDQALAAAPQPSALADRLFMQLKSDAERAEAAKTAPEKAESATHSRTLSHSTSTSALGVEKIRAATQVVNCKVCVCFQEPHAQQPDTPQGTRRGTNATSDTVKSDKTVKEGGEVGTEDKEGDFTVTWRNDVFEGIPLGLNPMSMDVESRGLDDTCNFVSNVGGTFFVANCDEDHREAVLKIFEAIFYAACAIILERSFLQDLEAFSIEKAPQLPKKDFTPFSNARKADEEAGMPTDQIKISANRRNAHWSHGLWGMLGGQGQQGLPKLETAVDKLRSAGGGMRRTATMDSSVSGMPSSHVSTKRGIPSGAPQSPYARWGKNLFSSVYKRGSSNADINGTRGRASTDLDQGIAARLRSNSSKSIRQLINTKKVPRPAPARPLCISPYRQTHDAEKNADFLKGLIAQQHISFTILEGLDAALPFAQDVKDPSALTVDSLKWPPTSMRKRPSLPGRQGSSISVASSALTISSRFVTASQLLSANEESRTLSAIRNDEDVRREITFYQHIGGPRDMCLGQAVEEFAAKAEVLSQEAARGKAGKDPKAQPDPASQTTTMAQYLHGSSKIIVCATILSREEQKQARSERTKPAADESASDGDAEKNATAMDGKDTLSAEIKAMRQDKPQTQTQTSHTLLASSREESKVRPVSGPAGPFNSNIEMWQADMLNDRQSAETKMSSAAYLYSFSAYLNALVSHPMLHDKSALQERTPAETGTLKHIISVFRVGRVMLKFDVRPVTVLNFFVDGPVVSADTRQPARIKSEASKEAGATKDDLRFEIEAYFSSVKQQFETARMLLDTRDTDKRDHLEASQSKSRSRENSGSAKELPSTTTNPGSAIEGAAARTRKASQVDKKGDAAGEKPLDSLAGLEASVQDLEVSLKELLESTEAKRINDVRYRFSARGRSIKARLTAWKNKHLTKDELNKADKPLKEPEYFVKGNYAFPGSTYLIRTDEPLSIIAYSLSSSDFQEELVRSQNAADVLDWRSRVISDETVKKPDGSRTEGTSEAEDSALLQPLRIRMKRKKHNREGGFLSMRIRSGQQLSLTAESAVLGELDTNTEAASVSHEDCEATPVQSRIVPPSVRGDGMDTVSTSGNAFRARVSAFTPQKEVKEMFPGDDSRDDSTIASRTGSVLSESVPSNLATAESISRSSTPAEGKTTSTLSNATITGSTFTSSPRHSIGSASRASSPRLPQASASPHIKHILLVGNDKISCVSWFAKDFAKLRQRWAVEEDFIASLSRSKSWASTGGKSKSGFYITSDGKWIAKQLLNIWTIDEKEAFLDFAPSYLRHMMGSADKDCPTLLVKIAGVFSVKIKDVKTGELKVRLSVQLLENVFAGDDGRTLKFDLKGIRERRVATQKAQQQTATAADARPSQIPSSVWWDGEWLDAIQPRAFVSEEDLARFKRALRNDLPFLVAANVMDYSLLVGLHEPDDKDESTPWLRARIVDFLGAWTLVKQLESSSKKAIKSQKPTIIPPQEYAARFREAVETYFIGCPT